VYVFHKLSNFLFNRKKIEVKKIYKSKKRHLWVFVMGLVLSTSQYTDAQNVSQVQVYETILDNTFCFGGPFKIDTINILELDVAAFGNTASNNNSVTLTPPTGYEFTSVDGTVLVNHKVNDPNTDVDGKKITGVSPNNGVISFDFQTDGVANSDMLNVCNLILEPIPGTTTFDTTITVSVDINGDANSPGSFNLNGYNMQTPTIGFAISDGSVPYCEFIEDIPFTYNITSGTCTYDSLVAYGIDAGNTEYPIDTLLGAGITLNSAAEFKISGIKSNYKLSQTHNLSIINELNFDS
jgi:hypothetical protein